MEHESRVGWTGLGAAGVALVAFLACRAPKDEANAKAARPDSPYVVVLGVAQDGGFPQVGCRKPACEAARIDASRARNVVSLLLVDPRTDERWLFEATPDLKKQVELARGHGGPPANLPGRPPLFDGVFLTHAHAGHYLGLWMLGREAYGTAPMPVHATRRMTSYLAGNGPWSLMVDAQHLDLRPFELGERIELAPDLAVTAFEVPHRAEFTDTVGFVIEGPERHALFLPDIDKWERFETPIEALIGEVDVAYLDATFFDGDELPGRDMSQIPHPFVVESLARFAPLPAVERQKVRFIHLNHSNPLLDEASPAARRVEEAGHAVARQGEIFRL